MSRNFEWSDRAFLDLSLLNKGGSSLSDDAFDLLVTTACDDIAKIQVLGDAANSLQRLQANKKFKDVDHEWLNKIYHCLSMFLLKCASANLQVDETVEFLTRFNWSSQQVKNFKKIYTEQLENIQVALKVIGKDPPEIVDVNWRLDYQLESSAQGSVKSLLYTIDLVLDDVSSQETLTFTATHAELEDLVATLKDACHSVKRTAAQ